MSPKERRRIAKRALKRDPLRPRTHTGRLLHPLATLAAAAGGHAFDAEHYTLDARGRVIALPAIDMFEPLISREGALELLEGEEP